jgi:hypothetical protein
MSRKWFAGLFTVATMLLVVPERASAQVAINPWSPWWAPAAWNNPLLYPALNNPLFNPYLPNPYLNPYLLNPIFNQPQVTARPMQSPNNGGSDGPAGTFLHSNYNPLIGLPAQFQTTPNAILTPNPLGINPYYPQGVYVNPRTGRVRVR